MAPSFLIRSAGQSHQRISCNLAIVSSVKRFPDRFWRECLRQSCTAHIACDDSACSIIAPSPTVTPAIITASYPIQTSFPITISPRLSHASATSRGQYILHRKAEKGMQPTNTHQWLPLFIGTLPAVNGTESITRSLSRFTRIMIQYVLLSNSTGSWTRVIVHT